MKTLIRVSSAAIALLVFLASSAIAGVSAAEEKGTESAAKAYREGVAAFEAKDLTTAWAKFNDVLKVEPRHSPSLRYLAAIRNERARELSTPALEKQCRAVSLAEFKLEAVALRDALEYLSKKTKEQTEGKFHPNIVFKGPEELANREVSIVLGKVSTAEVLEIITRLTNTKVTYENYAIVVESAAVDATPILSPKVETSRSGNPESSAVRR